MYITVIGECVEDSFFILVSVFVGCPFEGSRNINPASCHAMYVPTRPMYAKSTCWWAICCPARRLGTKKNCNYNTPYCNLNRNRAGSLAEWGIGSRCLTLPHRRFRLGVASRDGFRCISHCKSCWSHSLNFSRNGSVSLRLAPTSALYTASRSTCFPRNPRLTSMA